MNQQMITKHWAMPHGDASAAAATLADVLNVSLITAAVLVNRGVVEREQARQWMAPSADVVHDPFLMADMDCAVERLHQAVERGERVCCYGDYDVDGVSATALYWLFLKQRGARVESYIPDRQREGYGLNCAAIRKLAADGVTLLVTIDCGTTSHREVALARELGLDVIITDHHQIAHDYPPALAFLNPHRRDCGYPFKGLCSGGLAYKVATAYEARYGVVNESAHAFVDLAALATVADMVPLHDENRWLVREGLQRMSRDARPGIEALKQCLGVPGDCTESVVAFRLGPALNAAGRLGRAQLGLQLLTSESLDEQRDIAQHLDRLNRQRRELEQETVSQALRMIEGEQALDVVVIGDRAWHVGVVGIVASRLVERVYRPSVVVAFDGEGYGRGSVRSVPGLDICRLLEQCRDLLEGFGGHPAAAGLQVREPQLPELRERLSALVRDALREERRVPTLRIDASVSLKHIQPRVIRELDGLSPFGMGNPEPVFVSEAVSVLEQRVVGGDHLKLTVRQRHSLPFDCIGFRMGAFEHLQDLKDRTIDLAFRPEVNRWKGMDRVQLRIQDIKVRETMGSAPC